MKLETLLNRAAAHAEAQKPRAQAEPETAPPPAQETAPQEPAAVIAPEPDSAPAASEPKAETPLVSVENLKIHFPIRRGLLQREVGAVKAVDGVDFAVKRGETLGLVGESGCGKSTTGRAVLRLYEPTEGRIIFDGRDIADLDGVALRDMRPRMQMIFQDPQACLNPRMTIGEIIAEPLREHGDMSAAQRRDKVRDLLDSVGLNPAFTERYPHEFSGGQRQRVGIARAIALDPDFIICDEPIAALDVSIQAQVVNLLEELQRRLGLTYLFISHDLSMVRHIATRVAVMYLGKIVELADREALYSSPRHPYTRALLSAAPLPDPKLERQRKHIILKGDPPSPANPPSGCRFRTRCPLATEHCAASDPEFRMLPGGRQVACHYAE